MTHHLKTLPEFFEAILTGAKNFEVRRNDRGFAVGDTLILEEWDDRGLISTGRAVERRVDFVLYGGRFGVAHDHVVMAMAPRVADPAQGSLF